jgi:EcsC protein family
MSNENNKDSDSALMKVVQAIAITPEDARVVVSQYEGQLRAAEPSITDAQLQNLVVQKIVRRYARLSATAGGATALAGVVPGVGTAISMVGGSVADISVCIKLQVDMTMCLAVAINKQLNNEDAKHLSYLIALFGSLEQAASKGATRIASEAGVKMINSYLKGPLLTTIKELFKRIGIQFTKKAAIKIIPFGVGVVIGASTNYALTRYVGKNAIEFLRIHLDKIDSDKA